MRTPDGHGAATASIATGLAVLAVVVVLVAAVVTGLAVRDDTGSDGAASGSGRTSPDPGATGATGSPGEPEEEVESFFPDGQVITGDRRDNANVEVPSVEAGWERSGSSFAIGYLGRDGLPGVGVTGPYRWRVGPCGDEADDERAWVGFTAPYVDGGEDDLARASLDTVVEAWETTIRRDRETLDVSEVETSTMSLSDGSDAAAARFVVRFSGEGAGACVPPAYELRFLSVDTGDFAANLVLQRGVRRDGSDAAGQLDAETADQILASARRQQDP